MYKATAIGAVLGLGLAVSAQAAEIDVLFYGGDASQNNFYTSISATAHTYDPDGDGSNTWNATIWNDGDPTPVFSNYDALFIGSPGNAFGTGINFNRLLSAKSDIEAARGSRTFLTGQDADYHYKVSPGPVDNGPRGFIINAVNWAASGTGLGIVSMTDGWAGTGSSWWLDINSFLRDELDGYVQYFQDDSVYLGVGQESFPINEGLTSAGLSNWGVSSHSGFLASIPGYETINFENASSGGRAVTIVTEGEASGGTDPEEEPRPIPAPGTLLLIAISTLGLAVTRRRSA